MIGLLFFLLIILSGVPAAAIVCDLVFCERPPVAAHSCHDQSTNRDGVRLTTGANRCAHLAVVAPFLPPAARASIDVAVTSVFLAAAPQIGVLDTRFANIALANVPRSNVVPQHRPLRI